MVRAIAFLEYCLQVPANRLGYGRYTAAQLKVAAAFALVFAAVVVVSLR